ncbi:MAG: sigW 1 [Parcubacteria group bacterium]|nr:sigW 1 [Parcubacteria group bacterium]
MPATDEELLQEYLNGDEAAFERLVERHLTPLYAFIYRLCGNPDEAKDLTQETFLKAWKNVRNFDQERSFKTWLFAIARNTTFDYLRKRKQILFSELDTETESFESSLEDTLPLPEELFAQNESQQRVEQALLSLSPDYRSIVLLHDTDSLTFEAIAEIVGKPMNTVKSQYRRALLQMRAFLSQMPK